MVMHVLFILLKTLHIGVTMSKESLCVGVGSHDNLPCTNKRVHWMTILTGESDEFENLSCSQKHHPI